MYGQLRLKQAFGACEPLLARTVGFYHTKFNRHSFEKKPTL